MLFSYPVQQKTTDIQSKSSTVFLDYGKNKYCNKWLNSYFWKVQNQTRFEWSLKVYKSSSSPATVCKCIAELKRSRKNLEDYSTSKTSKKSINIRYHIKYGYDFKRPSIASEIFHWAGHAILRKVLGFKKHRSKRFKKKLKLLWILHSSLWMRFRCIIMILNKKRLVV